MNKTKNQNTKEHNTMTIYNIYIKSSFRSIDINSLKDSDCNLTFFYNNEYSTKIQNHYLDLYEHPCKLYLDYFFIII